MDVDDDISVTTRVSESTVVEPRAPPPPLSSHDAFSEITPADPFAMTMEMNALLKRQNRMLENELRRLRAEQAGDLRVLVFGNDTKVSVAVATTKGVEGDAVWSATVAKFEENRDRLTEGGVTFSTMTVQPNHPHATPFAK